MAAAARSVSERLQVYGLKPEQAFPEALVVPEGKSLTISPRRTPQPTSGFVTLEPQSIDDVKQWIGVPDSVGRLRNLNKPTSGLALLEKPEDVRALSTAQRQGLQDLAHQYVYGDSTQALAYKSSLTQLAVNGSVSGVFLLADVDVLPNAVLKLAKGLKVFFANNIRIWQGGEIHLLGDVKIDCASLTGKYTAPKRPTVHQPSLDLGKIAHIVNAGV